jgi:hypothetical protein
MFNAVQDSSHGSCLKFDDEDSLSEGISSESGSDFEENLMMGTK